MRSFIAVALLAAVSRVLAAPLAPLADLVGPYAQCGGIGYGGNTDCYPKYTCVKLNDWFSQCQPVEEEP